MGISWNTAIDRFWEDFDGSRADEMLAEMRRLVDQSDGDDGAALYEWASVHDSLGMTADAIGLYRRSIAAGLDEVRAPQAALQLASSLRAAGRVQECVDALDAWEASPNSSAAVIGDAAVVVRALALHDLGRHTEALRVALVALSATLPKYQRSMTAYAENLGDH